MRTADPANCGAIKRHGANSVKILITGNMGYVGPEVVRRLRAVYPSATLHGIDTGLFAHCLTGAPYLPERNLDQQIFADVRDLTTADLRGYDAVVQLAAVSNDPMGKRFEAVTDAINHRSSVALARAARAAGVASYVYASSCSIYGIADGPPRREGDTLNPITAYARSKIATEQALAELQGDMVITSLRFSTACGMSDRLRLDLVVNDFMACALGAGEISILSDGTPWRPMIDIRDMARAIEWAIERPASNGGRYLAVNVGSDDRNYQVRDLADAVARAVPGTKVAINLDAPVDSRSYRVDFSLFKSLAPDHQPQVTIDQSAAMLKDGLERMGFRETNFRDSLHIRLRVLETLISSGQIDEDLRWRRAARAPLPEPVLVAAE
jgi:nucleoside-diphosphate-sugar epimerase